MEEFKIIEGHENYLVSSEGRVYSLRSKKFLKLKKHANGYLSIRFSMHGKNYLVHRLVAQAFLHNEHNYKCVDHINNVRSDNRACNLRWCDHKQNNSIYKTPGSKRSCGYKHREKLGFVITEKINDEISISYLSLNSVPNISIKTLQKKIKEGNKEFTTKKRTFYYIN